ncbi:amino acid ABC transporter substrate-binding protein [Salidesulfovibrio onnuriiensis]|uniref:amino acid ABC transporter substrate-binding protein n=1 Tax=Salidesulfovibrio onnuriiensis TaxID=2583823 RepID=UPI0011C79D28|nr:amino acid ABC transporter substrate-binding protein [Salidesulfovibrio onnuriiensis]
MNIATLFFLLALPATAAGEDVRTYAEERSVTTKTMVMTHPRPVHHPMGCWLKAVYTDAFRRLGYAMRYEYVPAARASDMAELGHSDGELGRTFEYGDDHPALVRVSEPHLDDSFRAYTALPGVAGLDWKTLRNSGYTIAYTRGVHRLKREFGDYDDLRIHVVNNTNIGLRMLLSGRVDVFVGPQQGVKETISASEFAETPIHEAGTLESHTAHAYLNARHKELAPRLAAVLRQMKEEGILQRFATACGGPY